VELKDSREKTCGSRWVGPARNPELSLSRFSWWRRSRASLPGIRVRFAFLQALPVRLEHVAARLVEFKTTDDHPRIRSRWATFYCISQCGCNNTCVVLLRCWRTMWIPPLQNRLAPLWAVALFLAMPTGVFLSAGGTTAFAGCSKAAEAAAPNSGDSESEPRLEWSEDSPRDRSPAPEARLAEGSPQTGLQSNTWKPSVLFGLGAGSRRRRSTRQRHSRQISSRVPLSRSLQALLCRWIV
jgi:hypothetical protein